MNTTNNTSLDHCQISFDLNKCPTVYSQRPSNTSIQSEPTDYSKLLRKIAGINILSFACTMICIIFDLVFTLIILGIGASNRSSCPIEPRIPMYLIVYGSINLLSLCFSICACLIYNQGKGEHILRYYCIHFSAILIILFQLFNFIWLIVGSIWVFSIFNDVQYIKTDYSKNSYCQGSLYQFTVVAIILQYILPLIIGCCKNVPFHF